MANLIVAVDSHDKFISAVTKDEAHSQRLLHRQVYVLIVNSDVEMLLQRRSLLKTFDPGKWTTSVSGHVDIEDESYFSAAVREVGEELGIVTLDLVSIGNVIAVSYLADQMCGGPSEVFVMLFPSDLIDQESA